MEKAGARGVSGQGGSAPHPWGPSLQDTASSASELVLPPRGRHLFFNLLQFHSHLPGPSTVWSSRCHGSFPLFCPHHFLNHHFCFPGLHSSFQLHQQKFPLSSSFLFAQGQIVVSSKSLSDDWVRWTHQARFQLSFGG